jgi:hypothetical protein
MGFWTLHIVRHFEKKHRSLEIWSVSILGWDRGIHLLWYLVASSSSTATDGQSVWFRAPIWGPWPDLYYCRTFAVFLFWGALPDERTGLNLLAQFVVTLGPKFRRTNKYILRSSSTRTVPCPFSASTSVGAAASRDVQLQTWYRKLTPPSSYYSLLLPLYVFHRPHSTQE